MNLTNRETWTFEHNAIELYRNITETTMNLPFVLVQMTTFLVFVGMFRVIETCSTNLCVFAEQFGNVYSAYTEIHEKPNGC